jgi:diacylglycerol kinase family enzyme
VSLAVIINPVSGGGRDRGRERAAHAVATLAAIGRTAEIVVSERRGHAHDLARAAVARGATVIASWGGDGTMNEIASALVNSSASIALIPSGSGNGLARTLRVSLDPARAMVEAFRAPPRVIDGGRCGADWFFSVAGVGFDAYVAAGFDVAGRHRRGLRTYARVAVRGLLTYRSRTYTIDGVRLGQPALLVTVANAAQFGNGAWIAPAAQVDDGRLDLVVVEERSRLASMAAVPRLFTRTIDRVRGVSTRTITRVVIEDDVPIPYHLDGEPKLGGQRLEMQVCPAVLRVSVR